MIIELQLAVLSCCILRRATSVPPSLEESLAGLEMAGHRDPDRSIKHGSSSARICPAFNRGPVKPRAIGKIHEAR